jgi:hypothetical protein
VAFLDLKNAVIRLSPNQISITLAGEVVNAAYTRVVRARNWTSVHTYQVLSFEAPITAGTVTATRAATLVTGSGTGFDATHVNRMFQIGNSVPIRIASVGGATNLTLSQAWGKDTVTGGAYRILDNRFSLGTNVERVLGMIAEDTELQRKPPEFINMVDPNRVQRATPRMYAEFEMRPPTTARREIELWPIPFENLMVGLWYKALPPAMSADDDIPVVPETLVEYSAQAEGCRILFGRTGDGNWVQLGQTYEQLFKDALGAYMSEDMISQAEPPAPAAAGAAA